MLQKLKAMRGWPLWLRFALTGAALLAAHFFQIPLETDVPGEPFLLFFLIVIGSTLAFGEGAGLFGVGLSTFLTTSFFEPFGTLAIRHAADLVKIELYALIAGGCVVGFARLGKASIAAYEATEVLEKAERNKSILLRELAHRVANNFATVAALIHMKSAAVSDAEAKSVLNEAIEQITVMARVHGRLHAGNDRVSLDSEDFILELCKDLKASTARGRPLSIECVAVSRALSVPHAIGLGLIVNELVTNAIKYAFPDNRPGTVRVSLNEGDGRLCLAVEDDGVGLRGRVRGSGMGQELVGALTHQLGGQVEIDTTDKGSSFRLAFPYANAAQPSRPAAVLLH